jgi:hypothetical protein
VDRKNWWLILGTTAALAAATVLVIVLKRSHLDEHLANVPDLITECYDRINELEADLTRLRSAAAQPAAS